VILIIFFGTGTPGNTWPAGRVATIETRYNATCASRPARALETDPRGNHDGRDTLRSDGGRAPSAKPVVFLTIVAVLLLIAVPISILVALS